LACSRAPVPYGLAAPPAADRPDPSPAQSSRWWWARRCWAAGSPRGRAARRIGIGPIMVFQPVSPGSPSSVTQLADNRVGSTRSERPSSPSGASGLVYLLLACSRPARLPGRDSTAGLGSALRSLLTLGFGAPGDGCTATRRAALPGCTEALLQVVRDTTTRLRLADYLQRLFGQRGSS